MLRATMVLRAKKTPRASSSSTKLLANLAIRPFDFSQRLCDDFVGVDMCEDAARGLIEGVGNEVLYTVPVFAALVVGLLGFAGWQQLRQLSPSTAHPRRHDLTSERLNNGAAAPDRGGMQQQSAPSTAAVVRPPHYGSDAQCPICLAEPRHPVETNCGHLFCGWPPPDHPRPCLLSLVSHTFAFSRWTVGWLCINLRTVLKVAIKTKYKFVL